MIAAAGRRVCYDGADEFDWYSDETNADEATLDVGGSEPAAVAEKRASADRTVAVADVGAATC